MIVVIVGIAVGLFLALVAWMIYEARQAPTIDGPEEQ